ncbi:MAG: FtsX-like permease family protein, partial [Candidatus Hodarchaeales archaeon]
TEDAFLTLVDGSHLALDADEIFIHSITVIAGGDVFSGQTYSEVDRLYAELRPLSQGANPNFSVPQYTPKSAKDELRNMMFLSLVFGLFGTFMVSTLYSYLITRFRRREVAVLKAMGYSKWSVRIVVLSEILVVAVTGFTLGLFGIQMFIYLTRSSAYVYNIVISSTAILSFLAVVLSSVPGFILITTRILGVRPIEIFRQK